MKKFTFLIAFFAIAFTANSQYSKNLQNKIEKVHEKCRNSSEIVKSIEIQYFNRTAYLKSAAATQKLDSAVTQILNRESSEWQYDYKDEYYYNSEFESTSWLNKEWDNELQVWNIWNKSELGYDSNGFINSMLMYERDFDSKELVQNGKIMIYSNSDGIQDSILMYSKLKLDDPWVLELKQVHQYNDKKQLTKTGMWAFDEDLEEVVLIQNVFYTYTATGKIQASNTAFIMEGEEIPYSQVKYNYDGSEKLTSKVTSNIDFFTFTMKETDRYSYQYNPSGKVAVEIYSKWIDPEWVNVDKTQYTYNAAGDVSIETYSTWDDDWVETDKYEYLFSSTNFSEIVLPNFYFLNGMEGDMEEFNFSKQITGTNSYELIDGNWILIDKSVFYYSSGTSTKINETDNSQFSVYPVPASESVSFSWNENYGNLTLQLYQITGAKVLEQLISSDKDISISKLENGVYFFKLLDGMQSVHSGKLIKN